MFCPKCGTPNIEDAKYCRSCGADISLVPQALTRSLPDATPADVKKPKEEKKREKKEKGPPTIEGGLGSVFEGVGFLIIVAVGYYYFMGAILLWIWFIIPALSNIGNGLGQLISAGRAPQQLAPPPLTHQDALATPPHTAAALESRQTSEIDEHPFSVTEGTTRHLDATGASKR